MRKGHHLASGVSYKIVPKTLILAIFQIGLNHKPLSLYINM